MIPLWSMSKRSLRGLQHRTERGTFDGLTCEGEVGEWGRARKGERPWFGILMTLKKAVNK